MEALLISAVISIGTFIAIVLSYLNLNCKLEDIEDKIRVIESYLYQSG